MTTELEGVLRYWVHEIGPDRWYTSNAGVDDEIRKRFEALWRRAGDGDCDHWLLTPKGALALMIVLDQLPRNMFRGTAAAYRTDSKALCIAKAAKGSPPAMRSRSWRTKLQASAVVAPRWGSAGTRPFR